VLYSELLYSCISSIVNVWQFMLDIIMDKSIHCHTLLKSNWGNDFVNICSILQC
jgi:hypothetical protein